MAHAEVMRTATPGMMEYQLESLFQHHTYTHGGCRHQARHLQLSLSSSRLVTPPPTHHPATHSASLPPTPPPTHAPSHAFTAASSHHPTHLPAGVHVHLRLRAQPRNPPLRPRRPAQQQTARRWRVGIA
jgi:hypothetical protein